VTLNDTPGREASASRGLVAFDAREVPPPTAGAGAVMLVGFDGTSWGVFATNQNVAPPGLLPADIWICVDASSTNVHAGPGTRHRVVASVDTDQAVPAGFFQLTSTNRPGEGAGEGWFLVEGKPPTGWVSSMRVASADVGCAAWRASQQG
jgi:hypothetical protein